MWFYRALDVDGFPVAESYRKTDLIDKLVDEFGKERLAEFKIVRIYDKNIK